MWKATGVDVDAFEAVHSPTWDRLDELTRRRRLSGAEADELVSLYRQVAGHVSMVRTAAPQRTLIARLSRLVGRARASFSGARELSWADLARYAVISVPVAFYRVRWWTVWVGVAFVAVAAFSGLYLTVTPAAMAQLGSAGELRNYADEAFAAYYSDNPAPDFAAQVWTNNAWIAAQAVAGGITGIFTAAVLFINAVGVGQAGAIMATHGHLAEFFGLILPHGLMELTAIFVAGGAGLRLFWVALVPGPQSRARALAAAGRTTVNVVAGLVVVLLISGLVEGFVTPAAMPTAAKITIGALVLAAYWAYTIILGGRAARAGETGDLRQDEAGHELAEAA